MREETSVEDEGRGLALGENSEEGGEIGFILR
jgi:hypothetical protein